MYDELLKDLFEIGENRAIPMHIAETAKEAADAIEELMRRCEQFQYMPPPAWIPVTERLPEANEEVFIYLWDRPSPYIAWVDPEGRWETNNFYIDVEDTPKSWMPLPEPPKGEN